MSAGPLEHQHPLPRVTILIVNFNGARFLADCLKSLERLDYPSYEVVVVDNGSTDNSLEVLRSYPFVRAVSSSHNRGFAGGNNLGFPECFGEWILLLNNDTVVNPTFLRVLSSYMAAHPQVGIIQGKMRLSRQGGVLDVCGSFLTAFGLPYHYGYKKQDGPAYQRSFPVFGGKGACLFFRREVVGAAGGFLFDESFFCYYEETDFCHRAWIAGYETHFVACPPIDHLMGATADTMGRGFVLQHYLPNMAFSLWGNLSFWSRLRIMPAFLGFNLVAFLLATATGQHEQRRAHWAAVFCRIRRAQEIRQRRSLVRRIRRWADSRILRSVMRTPRLGYFAATFRGRLDQYRDSA